MVCILGHRLQVRFHVVEMCVITLGWYEWGIIQGECPRGMNEWCDVSTVSFCPACTFLCSSTFHRPNESQFHVASRAHCEHCHQLSPVLTNEFDLSPMLRKCA